MPIPRLQRIVEGGYDGGNQWECSFRKVPTQASVAGIWSDLSGGTGNPKANYYMGTDLTASTLPSTSGIYHGGDVFPKTKHLHKLLIYSGSAVLSPALFYLLDYVVFYPFVDMDVTDAQALENNSAPLPRYADGKGVQAMLVATNPYVGGAAFFITYTNDRGESGRQSEVVVSNSSATIGTILNSQVTGNGPFIPLAPGDGGIRSVESVTFLTSNGGVAALVLVKPLALLTTNDTSACSEWDFLTMKPTLPRIYDGAYLNFICCPSGSFAAAPLTGLISVIWN